MPKVFSKSSAVYQFTIVGNNLVGNFLEELVCGVRNVATNGFLNFEKLWVMPTYMQIQELFVGSYYHLM